MKVLFLDFDGVLNTDKARAERNEKGLPTCDKYEELFDEEAVENLRLILDSVPDVLIVVESAWKEALGGISTLRRMWKDRGMPGKIYGITKDGDNIADLLEVDLSDFENLAKVMGEGKGRGVRNWLDEHARGDCRYCIIDDVNEFLPEQIPFLVSPDSRIGLTEEDALKAIAILNG